MCFNTAPKLLKITGSFIVQASSPEAPPSLHARYELDGEQSDIELSRFADPIPITELPHHIGLIHGCRVALDPSISIEQHQQQLDLCYQRGESNGI